MTTVEKLWLLVSQTLNVILSGDPDESLSARAWREQNQTWIKRIDRLCGQGHCQAVHAQQMARQHART